MLRVSRLGSQPAGSLSVNLETHTADCLAPSAVLLCLTVGYQAKISDPCCPEFTFSVMERELT